MSMKELSVSVSAAAPSLAIQTPPEEPIKAREWAQAAVEIALLALIVLPAWALLGVVLIGPALLLKKYSHCFSPEGQKRIDQLYAFSTEIFDILAAGSKFFLAYGNKPLENVERKGRPILLVHGYLHNASAWVHFLKRLSEEKDIGPIYTINLGHPFLPLSEYAKRVDEKARAIRNETNQDNLILIGHSMGGVVSSLYASKAPEGSVSHVFTLGSPLAGSHLAGTLGVGPNGREMRPNAPILAEIQNGIKEKKKTRFYHAGSEADLLVSAESALSGCENQLRVSDLGHVGFLTSDKIIDWVCAELRSAP